MAEQVVLEITLQTSVQEVHGLILGLVTLCPGLHHNLRANSGIAPQLSPDPLLLDPLQFINHPTI
jgi:hypothetical protein